MPYIVIPSFTQNYAKNASQSQAPSQWVDLVGAWVPLLGHQGVNLLDVSGNGSVGTLTGLTLATAWTVSAKGWTVNCGNTGYVNIADQPRFSFIGATDLPMSIVIQVYIQDITETAGIISKWASGQREWILYIAGSSLFWELYVNSGENAISRALTLSSGLHQNRWLHLVCTYSGSENVAGLAIYINGALSNAVDGSFGTYTGMSNGTAPIQIGAYDNGGSLFNGMFSECRLYRRELTATDVAKIYSDPLEMYRLRRRRIYAVPVSGGILYTETLASSITAVSAVVKSVGKVISGNVTSMSALNKSIGKSLSSSITAVSSVVRVVYKVVSGSVTGVSAVSKVVLKVLLSSVLAQSSVVVMVSKVLSSSSVAVSSVSKLVYRVLVSSVTAVSSVVTQILHELFVHVFDSSITAASAVNKTVLKVLSSAVLAQSGVVKLVSIDLNSSIAAASAISKVVYRVLVGSITAASDAATQVLVGLFIHVFDSSITAVSAVSKVVMRDVDSAITAVSSVILLVGRVFDSSITGVSQVTKVVYRVFSGSVTMVSALVKNKLLSRAFSSSITAVSAVVTEVIAGSGVVAQRMWLYIRRRRRS